MTASRGKKRRRNSLILWQDSKGRTHKRRSRGGEKKGGLSFAAGQGYKPKKKKETMFAQN